MFLISSCRSAVPNLFDTRDRFHGRQFFHRQGGRMVQAVMMCAMPACSQLTSCCATWFLTGCGPPLARGLGTPVLDGHYWIGVGANMH